MEIAEEREGDSIAIKQYQAAVLEMQADGQDVRFDDVLDNIRRRDHNDCKQWAPLLASGRARQIDTTDMTIDQVDFESEPSHCEVMEAGKAIVPRLTKILRGLLNRIDQTVN